MCVGSTSTSSKSTRGLVAFRIACASLLLISPTLLAATPTVAKTAAPPSLAGAVSTVTDGMIKVVSRVTGEVILEVPARIDCPVGSFTPVTAKTTGKAVLWHAIDDGLAVFPSDLLRDARSTVVFGSKAGRFRLLVVTCVADELSRPAICTVVVGNDPGPAPVPPAPVPPAPVPPAPVPPVPPPEPTDPLYTTLKPLYDADPAAADTKAVYGRALASVYRQGAKVVLDNALQTNADLLSALAAVSDKLLPRTGLTKLRDRVAIEMAAVLGEEVDTALTAASRKKASELLDRLAKVMDAVSGGSAGKSSKTAEK